jgi:hypothetical protein
MKDYPTNKEEYWIFVDRHWEDLYDIIYRFAPELCKDADNYRLNQDAKLAGIFQTAWANAPDSPSIHYLPSWNVLCDLCSESYVLFDYDEAGNPL